MTPRIGITMGDPHGVGPEILLKALQRFSRDKKQRFTIFGDREFLQRTQKRFSYKLNWAQIPFCNFKNTEPGKIKFGIPTAQSGRASGEYIEAAVRAAQKGFIDAIVTLPINKVAFNLGGWGKRFVGHTEMLAALTHTKKYALMLMHGSLRAVHVTQHIPLKDVAKNISYQRVLETVQLTNEGLKLMGIKRPRIAVCGLNPHAGDSGLLGHEEKKYIAPAIRACLTQKIHAEGPLSADVVWPLVLQKRFDAGVAMYHDQGQIAVKLASFQEKNKETLIYGVNVTLGLPLIRTSVAHGTAYDIAGKGVASIHSFLDALAVAEKMASVDDSLLI